MSTKANSNKDSNHEDEIGKSKSNFDHNQETSKDLATSSNFKYIRFIIVSALKLKMNDITLATASMIFHKFFKYCKMKDFDPYLIAMSSMYLASKIEEQEIKLRDIINVSHRTLHPDKPQLEIGEQYLSLRNSVVQTELLIVRVLSFKFDFDHPHKYLLQYLDALRHWIPIDIKKESEVAEVSWSMLRDLLHSDLFFHYRPQEIALSIIYLVFICYGVSVPFNDMSQRYWWEALDDKTTKHIIHDIINEIIDIYKDENEMSFSFK